MMGEVRSTGRTTCDVYEYDREAPASKRVGKLSGLAGNFMGWVRKWKADNSLLQIDHDERRLLVQLGKRHGRLLGLGVRCRTN
jgi:hypothetical protein